MNLNYQPYKSKYWVSFAILLGLFLTGLALAHSHRREQPLGSIQIQIKQHSPIDTLHFLNGKIIRSYLKSKAKIDLDSISVAELNVGEVEKVLRQNEYVRHCQVATDVKGNLWIEIEEHKPLARLWGNETPSCYLTENATFFPASPHFALRTLLLTGAGVDKMQQDTAFFAKTEGKELLDFLRYIEKDKFWRAQIAQIHLDSRFELTLFPQIGEQEIEFGTAQNFEQKLDKIKVFYEKIIPNRGWGRYKTVSVKYAGQIVCK
jgi:cell division protein FtsQ